jgi:predicted  nucleic acid-binding Zn-ribbon protein
MGGVGEMMEYHALEEEVQRLRTENALLKRSTQDLMNSMNELSNRLFDVDESLKKVANVFPKEEEMESWEWLLRR